MQQRDTTQQDPPHIRCLAGPAAGRSFRLRPERPVSLSVRNRGGEEGTLEFRQEAGAWVFRNCAGLSSTINGEPLKRAVLADGDTIRVGPMEFRAVLPDPESGPFQIDTSALPEVDPSEAADGAARPTEKLAPGQAPDAESDRVGALRSSRRISASREAVVVEDERPSKGRLIHKVGRALRRRDKREERLERLRDDRRRLLQALGRLALERVGGFGLDSRFLPRLCAGETLTVTLGELDQGELERYRVHCDHLKCLDIEIEALCHELGLGPDVDGYMAPDPLPTEQYARAERAFRASDAMPTDDLDGLAEELADDEEADTDGAAPTDGDQGQMPGRSAMSSGRRRARRRRR